MGWWVDESDPATYLDPSAAEADEAERRYAESPTVLDWPPLPATEIEDDVTQVSESTAPGALVSIEDAPAYEDTAWRTPAYATRRPPPVIQAAIPPYDHSYEPPPPRPARLPAAPRGGVSDAVLVHLVLALEGLAFVSFAGLVVALAWLTR